MKDGTKRLMYATDSSLVYFNQEGNGSQVGSIPWHTGNTLNNLIKYGETSVNLGTMNVNQGNIATATLTPPSGYSLMSVRRVAFSQSGNSIVRVAVCSITITSGSQGTVAIGWRNVGGAAIDSAVTMTVAGVFINSNAVS